MLNLTPAALRQIFPTAPQTVLNAFTGNQTPLAKVGLLDNPTRLSFCLTNLHAETGGFSIPRLQENINYTAERMAQVWPNRFLSASAVRAKYGTDMGWQRKAFDDIYGNRMGNRPGTSDGSRYIGRGGPQITGRDGYAEIGRRIGVDLINNPESASLPELQPAIAAAFWDWKKMNAKADAGDFLGCVKLWNGGTNGLAERKAQLARISKIVDRLPRGLQTQPTALPKAANDNVPTSAAGGWAAVLSTLAGLFKRKAA
jgi:predicted chitinase